MAASTMKACRYRQHHRAASQPAILQRSSNASRALAPTSAYSSRNSTPRCARLTAPGRAIPVPRRPVPRRSTYGAGHERRPGDQWHVAREQAGHRMDRGDLQRLAQRQLRSRPEAVSQHRFADTGGPVSISGAHRGGHPDGEPGVAFSTTSAINFAWRGCRRLGPLVQLSCQRARRAAVPVSAHPAPRCRRPGSPHEGCRPEPPRRASSRLAVSTAGSTPLTERTRPSSANSPNAVSSSRSHPSCRVPTAPPRRQSDRS